VRGGGGEKKRGSASDDIPSNEDTKIPGAFFYTIILQVL
jgi:hypothetical protein